MFPAAGQPSAVPRAGAPLQYSPAGWGHVEDDEEARRVLARIWHARPLDVYQCADLYDLAYPGYRGDREFYLERGKSGDVLYLGAGTGRLFGPLAAVNPQAVGLELSPRMLDLLRVKYPSVPEGQLVLADALTADLRGRSFDLILAPYSFFQFFDEAQLGALLGNVRCWLRPGGRFVTDTFSPFLIPFRRRGIERYVLEGSEHVEVAIHVLYDHLRQTMREYALFTGPDGQERAAEMNMHYHFPREVGLALTGAGFTRAAIRGDYTPAPFDAASHEVVVYEAGAD